jgi:hypothetical protein
MSVEAIGDHSSSFNMSAILLQRRWLRRALPFPHVIAQHVFAPAFYCSIEEQFRRLLASGSDFKRNMPGYDAVGYPFTPQLAGPLAVFVSRSWHDLVADIMDVEATYDIDGSLHSHEVLANDGSIHNDLAEGWFVDEARRPDGVNVTDRALCSYNHGTTKRPGLRARRVVRGVAILFYLDNAAWIPGDGGETGLYRTAGDEIHRPAAVVPPLNNSVLIFKCTPRSFHSFLRNSRTCRNSVTMWLHRPWEDVVGEFGEASVVKWPRGERI